MYTRENTHRIDVGTVPVGGGTPVSVQSMANTATSDIEATTKQIQSLADAGCDIVRLAVPDKNAAEALPAIRKRVPETPLVADIHFDYRLALAAVDAGFDKLRINPGNIGAKSRVREVAQAAERAGIPIRVGVNAGSLRKDLLSKHGGPIPEALVESAEEEVDYLAELGFTDVCVSLKSSSVTDTIRSYTLFAERRANPLHVGITEAGTLRSGIIKSACGIGAILSRGLGDTIRVSLTADPVEEVVAGIGILKSLKLRSGGAEVISCPTCGRTAIDIISLAEETERRAASITTPMKIAVMGCVVNGPGEAREADYGIAGGRGEGLVFKHGEIIKKVPEQELIDELFRLIEADTGEGA
jgi:(E)-4-hydroxy-3-methylbut-2-enyl-diphosphate synthase